MHNRCSEVWGDTHPVDQKVAPFAGEVEVDPPVVAFRDYEANRCPTDAGSSAPPQQS